MKQPAQWVIVGDILVSFGRIRDELWDDYINDFKTKGVTKYLGTTIGHVEVNSVKRKEIFEVTKGRGIKVAIVTDERIVRGIATAASWVGVNVKAFSWEELREAVRHLGIPSSLEERVIDAVMQLKAANMPSRKL